MILLDYKSLLMALSFCSAGVALTFFVSWLVSQSDRYLMIWGMGSTSLVVSILAYWNFVANYSPVMGMIAFSALEIGLILLFGAAHQFRTGVLPVREMLIAAVVANAATAIPMALGYDGVCYIIFNFVALVLLCATGLEYWRCRSESPLLIGTLAGLYVIGGLSFGLCAFALAWDQSWIINGPPNDWAENLNLVICLIDTAAIGALSLGLNQIRLTRRHKKEAETDALTGLFNRRAFFDQANLSQSTASVVVVVFDIDHFKLVNDSHGHQIGDNVLRTFALTVSDAIRDEDVAARLGGEEFGLVLPNASLQTALLVSERIRKRFSERRFLSEGRLFGCTVSAGISKAGRIGDLEAMMVQADAALYVAKRSGRDRVILFSSRDDLRISSSRGERIEPADSTMGTTVDIAPRIAQRKARLTRPH
ncbi:diguanylate cyclase [Hyphomicrobium sp.]|uniref:GGDEF domain-containing protein n=1 Tax=Hyphomicrobium sp. TaxID=82 RepID=UPI000FADDB0D|nr:GGDEF domain-containing protein [Hyphomicrobium sp.]RUO99579.1 MAG: GGDEF domain-containing protein [Hyphomicrobium sp.]